MRNSVSSRVNKLLQEGMTVKEVIKQVLEERPEVKLLSLRVIVSIEKKRIKKQQEADIVEITDAQPIYVNNDVSNNV